MRHLKTTLAVLGAVTVLVLAGNTIAMAATGHAFILGQANKANHLTSLIRTTSGPALKLKTTSTSAAPLTVTGHGKVANLNADKVDGLDAASLQTRTVKFTLPPASGVTAYAANLPGVAPGIYQATFSAIASGTTLNCDFTYPDSSYTVLAYGATAAGYVVANGAGVVDTRAHPVYFRCFGSSAFSFLASEPSQVTLTRIDALSSTPAVAARRSARTSSGAAR